ncbi:MAG: fatty acid desaturase [Spirochaetes bacterium]|jgi:omega-6 fatty acid desaturase (delta-12 desaturase)|nr:fatty acid desaturase [Spirochaetota bacterium]
MERNQEKPSWVAQLKAYEKPATARAVWQLTNTLIPYLGLAVLMYLSIEAGYPAWATILLSIPAAAFMVRLFVLFHDCSHGSFFKSQKANRIVGHILGVFAFTAYGSWQHGHGVHHSTSGNLDRRTIGEVWTLTAQEYIDSPWWKRLAYRIYRNPVFMFGVAPLLLFIVAQRKPHKLDNKRQRRSVWITNGAIAAIVLVATVTIGLGNYLLIQLTIMYFAGMAGIWLFYVQHQFDPGYWKREKEWHTVDAAMEGSSYYKLPKLFQWFSANIGLHHVHHLRPRIPNYNLQRCLDDIPELRLKDYLTVRHSFESVNMNLWDEANDRLISFRSLRKATPSVA